MKVVPMWETDNALYHFGEKERAEYLEGEKPDLKYVVVDEDFFISTWQYKDMEGIHGIFDREKEANEFAVEKVKEKYKEKIKSLLAEKEKELNVHVVSTEFDEDKNLHILCHRITDDSFIVWSSYYTGEEKTSFVNFYNGAYDMTLEQGLEVLYERSGKSLESGMDYVNDIDDKKTWDILNEYYNDCLNFWEKQLNNSESPEIYALKDVESIQRNPFSPNGEKLDTITKEKWISEKRKKLNLEKPINNPSLTNEIKL